MEIGSQQSGINFAYKQERGQEQGNAALDTVNQKAVELDEAKNSSDNGKIIEFSDYEQAKVNQSNADNLDIESIESALADVSAFVQTKNQDLSFSFDDETNRSIIKVTDAGSGEVIRQIPSEEVLKLSERIKSLQSEIGETVGLGVLLNNEV
ncbi:flagellar biosynthesis protein FlaG [Saccharobesus litoralis]|uniref:Flagellar biosynthesis protein FlaG n=1 Tax=Saccharobesus litoralis TaxID=2172099 RepID=A0A2S0VUM6_9ALTE|nr:flagellar protein FlaG [Saccharobesus litoralis]AWB67800.1 flagellar biosynthesis protein FlaG [Saccharobesus litoralis]